MAARYPDYIEFKAGDAPPPDSNEGYVRVYAASDGSMHTIQSDGTDTEIGAGGSGSQGVEGIAIPFSFDTPGISNYNGGAGGFATGWTPAVGDCCVGLALSVPTAFDGSNPTFYMHSTGYSDVYNAGLVFPSLLLTTADAPVSPADPGWLLEADTPSFGAEGGVCQAALEQRIFVLDSDDGSDPECSQGEAVLHLLVLKASS